MSALAPRRGQTPRLNSSDFKRPRDEGSDPFLGLLGHLVGDIAGVSGAAILGDGSVALIVDVAALIALAIRDNTTLAAPLPLPVGHRKLSHVA